MSLFEILYYLTLLGLSIYIYRRAQAFFLGNDPRKLGESDLEKDQEKSSNLDRLIRQKEMLLRGCATENYSSTHASHQSKTVDDISSPLLKGYYREIEWGEGELLRELKKQVQTKYLIELESVDIINVLKKLLRSSYFHNYLNNLSKHQLTQGGSQGGYKVDLKQVQNFIGAYLNFNFYDKKKNKQSKKDAYQLLLLKNVYHLDQLIEKTEINHLNDLFKNTSNTDIEKAKFDLFFMENNQFLDSSKLEALIGQSISELPYYLRLPSFSSDNALLIMDFESLPTKDQLKRRYKDLCQTYHPDKHSQQKNELLFKRVQENFQIIISAFEYLNDRIVK